MVKITPPAKKPTNQDRKAPVTVAQEAARKADFNALKATRVRKLDTRGKVILGGRLLGLLADGDAEARALFERMVDSLPREADRKTIHRVRTFWDV